jgi:hypothetical protein
MTSQQVDDKSLFLGRPKQFQYEGIPIYWLTNVVVGAGVTYWLGFERGGTPESGSQTLIPSSGTISDLYVYMSSAQPASGSAVYTFRKNAADTPITFTVAAGSAAGNYGDNTHSFGVTAGDLIDVQIVNNATANAGTPYNIVFKFTPKATLQLSTYP